MPLLKFKLALEEEQNSICLSPSLICRILERWSDVPTFCEIHHKQFPNMKMEQISTKKVQNETPLEMERNTCCEIYWTAFSTKK